jgi:hypothetical protein
MPSRSFGQGVGHYGVLDRFLDGLLHRLLDHFLHRVLDILVLEHVFAGLGHRFSHGLLHTDCERIQFLREDLNRFLCFLYSDGRRRIDGSFGLFRWRLRFLCVRAGPVRFKGLDQCFHSLRILNNQAEFAA